MERRLKELEMLTQEAKENMAILRKQVDEIVDELSTPSTFSAPLTPRPPVVCRPAPVLPPKIKRVKAKIGRRKAILFTREVCAQIPVWLEDGLSRVEIAAKIGCTVNSLQASCSNRGISLWAKGRPRKQPVQVVYEEVM
jgi:hypothetical protein